MRKMGIHRYGRLSQLLNDYDAGVHVADRGVEEVVAQLERTGRFDDALVIVTSDHGESFLDRGPFVGHGLGLTDDELGIPLIVKLPGGEAAGTRQGALVDLLDLAPTVLEAAGLPADPSLQGRACWPSCGVAPGCGTTCSAIPSTRAATSSWRADSSTSRRRASTPWRSRPHIWDP